jgi:hypothetical protein
VLQKYRSGFRVTGVTSGGREALMDMPICAGDSGSGVLDASSLILKGVAVGLYYDASLPTPPECGNTTSAKRLDSTGFTNVYNRVTSQSSSSYPAWSAGVYEVANPLWGPGLSELKGTLGTTSFRVSDGGVPVYFTLFNQGTPASGPLSFSLYYAVDPQDGPYNALAGWSDASGIGGKLYRVFNRTVPVPPAGTWWLVLYYSYTGQAYNEAVGDRVVTLAQITVTAGSASPTRAPVGTPSRTRSSNPTWTRTGTPTPTQTPSPTPSPAPPSLLMVSVALPGGDLAWAGGATAMADVCAALVAAAGLPPAGVCTPTRLVEDSTGWAAPLPVAGGTAPPPVAPGDVPQWRYVVAVNLSALVAAGYNGTEADARAALVAALSSPTAETSDPAWGTLAAQWAAATSQNTTEVSAGLDVSVPGAGDPPAGGGDGGGGGGGGGGDSSGLTPTTRTIVIAACAGGGAALLLGIGVAVYWSRRQRPAASKSGIGMPGAV